MEAGPTVAIRPLAASTAIRDRLAALLVEVVAHGGSVGFLHPLAPDEAAAFWDGALAAADRGERIVLGAWDGDALLGTVSLLLQMPPNQPHRAELAKMMTAVDHRGRGIASALVREAERLAVERRKGLVVLDTASDDGAAGLYEGLGYRFVGEIPDFALKPHGGLTGTKLYWKRLEPAADARC